MSHCQVFPGRSWFLFTRDERFVCPNSPERRGGGGGAGESQGSFLQLRVQIKVVVAAVPGDGGFG